MRFELEGAFERILFPPEMAAARADDLWRHTCFEAFVRVPGEESYLEFNFSPSSQWAAYGFTGYREGMTPVAADPLIKTGRGSGSFEIQIKLGLRLSDAAPWRLGLTAVVEELDGTKSYWALAHAADRPDFHRAESFVLELTPV